MKISRAPFRISFFGGGTDFKEWYQEHTSTIVSMSINKYCYVTIRELLPFYGTSYRVSWSTIENQNDVESINHPSIRECLKYKSIGRGVEIHTDGDLPARSGLGSSSSFTVAMLHACNSFKGGSYTNKQIAHEAIHVEQNLLKETVGIQDQIQSCYGGFNIINIDRQGDFSILSLSIDNAIIREIESSMILVYSGIQRISSLEQQASLASSDDLQNKRTLNKHEIHRVAVACSQSLLNGQMTINKFNGLLKESWEAKKDMLLDTNNNREIIKIYNKGISAGAESGKCLGAGGGGFLLFMVSSERHRDFKAKMDPYICIKPKVSQQGVHSIL